MMVQTEIGLLPEDWEVKAIGECLSIGNGRDYKHLHRGTVPVYGTGGIMTYVDQYLYDGETVCIGRKGTIDNPMYHDGKIWTVDTLFYSHHFKAIPKYMYYAFCQVDWMSYNEATGVPSLTSKRIEEIQVPVPPTTEQQNIASALSSIDKLIDDLGRTIQKKQRIREGAMEELLSGKKRLPGFTEEWVEKKIGEVCNTASGGTPSRSNPNYYTGKIKWFTTTELNDGWLLDSIEHISEEAIRNSSAKIFKEGTLLMAMYGATIGKLGILSSEAATNQACCAFESKEMDIIFLFYFLFAKRQQILSLGAGAGQPNISQQIIKNIPINIPPIKEQHAIADILTSMDDEISLLESERAKYEQIRSGMMEELLTGKKRLK